jgi:NADP-dependent 3-hydroxy acid dehydrogenase YdfG
MLNGKIAFITGGSSGYGKATAKKLSGEGANVIIAARNEGVLKEARKETGAADIFAMDVTKYGDWKRAYDFVKTNTAGLIFC